MIQVTVRHDHRGERRRFKRERKRITLLDVTAALKETTIEQKALAAVFDEMFTPRNGPGCAEKGQIRHG
jgi:hypothetical protein